MCNGEWPTIPSESVDIVVGDRVLLTLVSYFSSTIYYYTQINFKGNVPADICIVVASSDLQFDDAAAIILRLSVTTSWRD